MESATPLRRLMAYLLDGALFFLTLIVGYIIWWLIVLRRGQTPGK
jgi:phage shock protein PspC (stress-responsive transcriptional regulator)